MGVLVGNTKLTIFWTYHTDPQTYVWSRIEVALRKTSSRCWPAIFPIFNIEVDPRNMQTNKALPLMSIYFTIAIVFHTHATTFYVDAVNGNDHNSGTEKSRPWKSIKKVNEAVFSPGDSICFKKGGTWTGQLDIRYSGTTEKPIMFTSYGIGAKPVIQNPGVHNGSAISILADWIIVEGFLVRETHQAGISIKKGADHNIVRDNEATLAGMGIGVTGRYNLVVNNFSHDLTMITNTPGGDDDYGAVGIWLFGSNNEIAYNRMLNCAAPSHDYGRDGGMVEFYGDVDSCYVHHNWGENCNGAFEVGGKGETLTDNVIAYNVSINNLVSGGFHLGGKFGVILERFLVENNVFVDLGTRDYTIGLWRGSPAPVDIQYRNNIFYIPNHTKAMNQAGAVHEHNLYYMGGKTNIGVPLGKGERIGDPLFVSLKNQNFHLQPQSVAIDAGARLQHSKDYDGRIVPFGSSADMGAYEYQNARR